MVRRTIRASADRLFEAWTDPSQLTRWWGPAGVTCPLAEVDLRVDGRYRIANRLPDGSVVWITGAFERIAPPHLLVYTWRLEHLEHLEQRSERVTVRFESVEGATEVSVLHERIADAATRKTHESGWLGCLNRLEQYLV